MGWDSICLHKILKPPMVPGVGSQVGGQRLLKFWQCRELSETDQTSKIGWNKSNVKFPQKVWKCKVLVNHDFA